MEPSLTLSIIATCIICVWAVFFIKDILGFTQEMRYKKHQIVLSKKRLDTNEDDYQKYCNCMRYVPNANGDVCEICMKEISEEYR